MNLIDLRTVLFSYAISNFICMVVIAALWKQNRRRFAGLGLWLAAYLVQFGAILLIALRGVVPDLLSMTIGNAMVIGGTILLYIGMEHFLGKRESQIHNFILLVAFICSHAYFTFVQPNLAARSVLVSLGLLAISAQGSWLMLRQVSLEMRPITQGLGVVFAVYCLVSCARMVFDLAIPPQNDFFLSTIYDMLAILMYQMLFIILTFNLFLMVNRSLVFDLSQDITKRKQVEEALRQSEEKFHKAFHSSPDAILISRLSDGQIIEANEGFCHLSEYTREEALSKSAIALGLWPNPQDRERVVAELQRNQRVQAYELDFRNKPGKIITCLYSGVIIQLGGEAHILSIVSDISERKRTEDIVRLRLRLWEYATTYSIDELLQKGLDEISTLTESPISFYHSVSEDQNILTFQAWSTRALSEFIQVEGKASCIPIRENGMWVDCIRERKPVIYNDYACLPDRKGVPTGHVEFIRELVVPVLRNGRVVAILGVSNKPTDYDETDRELVSSTADIVWSIVAQKQADEQIRQLNARLEQMAMTDDLTCLANRRSFFKRGEEEIKRARRYHAPLSLLMLDIDEFKRVNDTWGHEAGDQVLRCLAHMLQCNIREIDILARLGGEEFGILLPNTSVEDAARLGERLRVAVEREICSEQDQSIDLTVSVGVVAFSQDQMNLDDMLRNADQAMYKAKKLGRNRVMIFTDIDSYSEGMASELTEPDQPQHLN